jgi:hypothetical protein
MGELERFTGEGWEQEDDITLLTLERSTNPYKGAKSLGRRKIRIYSADSRQKIVGADWRGHRAESSAQAYARSSASAKPAVVSVAATGHPRTKPKNGPKSRVAGKPVTKSPGTLDWK